MKKKLFSILSVALLLGSLGAAPAFAAEAGSAQGISTYYGCTTERLSDSDDDGYCGRGRGGHGGGHGGGYYCDGDSCYYRNR